MTTEFFTINLEKYKPEVNSLRTTVCEGRKKIIQNTPEEIVRQAFINYLCKEKGYPLQSILVERPMCDYKAKAVGRADIIIVDADKNPLCVVECKREGEFITENIWSQVLTYSEIVKSPSVCIVNGNTAAFLGADGNDDPFHLPEFPHYTNLVEFDFDEIFDYTHEAYKNLDAVDESYKILQNNAIIGYNTDEIYYPFLVKFFNLLYSDAQIIFEEGSTLDLGIAEKKFGNSSGSGYPGTYRSFLRDNENSVVSLAISSTTGGPGHPEYTTLLFAVQENIPGKTNNHLSLQLRVEKHIELVNTEAIITHDGTITIGKMGPGKRKELLKFVLAHKPELLRGDKVYLGKLNYNEEINPVSPETQKFITNCIDYALIRDKFRKSKNQPQNE